VEDDKYKVTDDGDMKARAMWRENAPVLAKAGAGSAEEKTLKKTLISDLRVF
jgi:hypothetical protein